MARIGNNKKEKEEDKKPKFRKDQLLAVDNQMEKAEKKLKSFRENEPEKASAIKGVDQMWLYMMNAIRVRETVGGYTMTVIPENYIHYAEKLKQWKRMREKRRYAKQKEAEEYDKMK